MGDIGQIFRKAVFCLDCGVFCLMEGGHGLVDGVLQPGKIVLPGDRKKRRLSDIGLFKIIGQGLDTPRLFLAAALADKGKKQEGGQESACRKAEI